MDPGIIIGALAFLTIGTVLAVSVLHFGSHLRNGDNRFHALNILKGGKSATLAFAEAVPAGSAVPLKTRLDQSIDSQHPDDPTSGRSKAERTADFNSQKVR